MSRPLTRLTAINISLAYDSQAYVGAYLKRAQLSLDAFFKRSPSGDEFKADPLGESLKRDPTGNALKSMDSELGIDLDTVIRPGDTTRTGYRTKAETPTNGSSAVVDQAPPHAIDPYDPIPFDTSQPHGHYEPDLHMEMNQGGTMVPAGAGERNYAQPATIVGQYACNATEGEEGPDERGSVLATGQSVAQGGRCKERSGIRMS